MSRPVQVDDQVQIWTDNILSVYVIREIDNLTIFISPYNDPNNIKILEPNELGQYQSVTETSPHEIIFLSGEEIPLTQNLQVDLQLLSRLSIEDLRQICSINSHLGKLCVKDELWDLKIIQDFGVEVLKEKPADIDSQTYYNFPIFRHPEAGINVTLALGRMELLHKFEDRGFEPTLGLIPITLTQGGPGFNRAIILKPEMMNFLQHGTFGPLVAGTFSLQTDLYGIQKLMVDLDFLIPLENTRLQDGLYFLQPQINRQDNPLYGVVTLGFPFSLFSIHAYYTSMRIPDDMTRLSTEMREYLGDMLVGVEPNNPMYAHISRIVEQSTIGPLMNYNRENILRVYSFIPGITLENCLEKVLTIQGEIILLANEYIRKLGNQ